ncbi:hypothetical protein [Salinimonas chungwhensis]|uniref:hypothetical protein n=1 Tax=Salinimonas chungwhensis TaxID=265425 RepID=UPI00037F1978|nr:hypothetical protein [Salinimonas chungwhensis]
MKFKADILVKDVDGTQEQYTASALNSHMLEKAINRYREDATVEVLEYYTEE